MHKGIQKKHQTTGKHQRIKCVLCALLALALTLTGLPVGGVEEVKAEEPVVVVQYGKGSGAWNIAGRIYSSAPSTMVVSGDGILSEAELTPEGRTNLDNYKSQITKVIIDIPRLSALRGDAFASLENLEYVEFKQECRINAGVYETLFANNSKIKGIILPKECSVKFKNNVQEILDYTKNELRFQTIEEQPIVQYTLTVVNGEITGVQHDPLKVSKMTFYSNEITDETGNEKSVIIKPMNLEGQIFKDWTIGYADTHETVTSGGIEPNKQLNLQLRATDIYVTANYKTQSTYPTAEQLLNRVFKPAIEGYASEKERSLTSIPTVETVQSDLNILFHGIMGMGDAVSSCAIKSLQQKEGTQDSTIWEIGHVSYEAQVQITGKNDDSDANLATEAAIAFDFDIQKKPDIAISVVLYDAEFSNEGITESLENGGISQTFLVSQFTGSPRKLSIPIRAATKTNQTFVSWDSQASGSGTVTLEKGANVSDNTLILSETSPTDIVLKVTYRQNASGGGTSGGGAAPSTPTTPEKPKEEEKPKDESKEEDDKKEEDKTKEEDKPAESKPSAEPAKIISKTTKTNTATVSVSDLKKAVKNKTNAGMKIKYQDATVTFDKKAVESIVKQAGTTGSSKLQIVCKPSAQSSLNSAQKKALKNKNVIGCYQIYLKCGNNTISDFGKGKVKVKVPLTLGSGQKSKNVKLYHVDEKGKLTKQSASYSKGYLTFTTTHFSIYAATYPKKTTQVLGKKNETIPGGVVDDSMIGLPAAEEHEEVSFHTLQLHLSRSNDTSVCLGWNLVPGASGYELYGARCNTKTKKYEVIQITTLDAPSMTAWMCDNLKKNTYYKFIVRAYMMYNGEKIYIARSRSAHVSTGGGGYGFIHDVIVDKSAVTLRVGKTSVIKATMDTAGQKIRAHYDLRFESTDPEVATVNNNGKITAKKKGTCTIYVYTQNGLYTTVKVTVQK